MEIFLKGLDHARNGRKRHGGAAFSQKQLERSSLRYDKLIVEGYETGKNTRGRLARKEEEKLLDRLVKYKAVHLLFLYDLSVHYSNNMSEKNLRICKTMTRWQEASGIHPAEKCTAGS